MCALPVHTTKTHQHAQCRNIAESQALLVAFVMVLHFSPLILFHTSSSPSTTFSPMLFAHETAVSQIPFSSVLVPELLGLSSKMPPNDFDLLGVGLCLEFERFNGW